jgi:hypothetical protein
VFPLRPLGSTIVTRFIATTGRSDSLTGTLTNYFFSATVDLPFVPIGLPGSLMFLNSLSDRAVLCDPGESTACV